jgi:hypothetical protein
VVVTGSSAEAVTLPLGICPCCSSQPIQVLNSFSAMRPPLPAMPKGFEALQRRDSLVAPTGLDDFRDVA